MRSDTLCEFICGLGRYNVYKFDFDPFSAITYLWSMVSYGKLYSEFFITASGNIYLNEIGKCLYQTSLNDALNHSTDCAHMHVDIYIYQEHESYRRLRENP